MQMFSRNYGVVATLALSCVFGLNLPLSAQPAGTSEEIPSTWPGAAERHSASESSKLVSELGAQGAPANEPLLVPAVPTSPEPVPYAEPQGSVSYPQEELAAPPGAVVQDGVTVHPVAKIDYDVTRKARKRFGGSQFVDLTMITQNPADGCFYEIPMCLPACCTGEPQVTSYCGIFGRGVVVYCYECGLEIEVKFRLRGDVEVEYGT